jgi:hypothetical protein
MLPAVEPLLLADKRSQARAAIDAYPRQHERRSQRAIADSLVANLRAQPTAFRTGWEIDRGGRGSDTGLTTGTSPTKARGLAARGNRRGLAFEPPQRVGSQR